MKVVHPIVWVILASAAPTYALVVTKTVPVGIVKLGDTTVGEDSVKANTDVRISIPFLKPAKVTAGVSSISGSTVTLQNILGSIPTISPTLPPYYLVIESGANAGLIAMVSGSTSTTVTVNLQLHDDLTSVAADDEITLRPAWTVATFFTGAVPADTQLMAWTGAQSGVDLAPSLYFQYTGTAWEDPISTGNVDDVVIYPNETFIVRSPSSIPIPTLAVAGEVSTIRSRAHINCAPSGQDNPITYFASAAEVLSGSGLSTVSETNDQIFLYKNGDAGVNKSPLGIIEYDGSGWVDVIFGGPMDDIFQFEPGVGYVYRRQTNTPALWSDLPDYLPLDSP